MYFQSASLHFPCNVKSLSKKGLIKIEITGEQPNPREVRSTYVLVHNFVLESFHSAAHPHKYTH